MAVMSARIKEDAMWLEWGFEFGDGEQTPVKIYVPQVDQDKNGYLKKGVENVDSDEDGYSTQED